MKKLFFIVLCILFTFGVYAQITTIDTFETYADTTAMLTVWAETAGYLNSLLLGADGGASSTTKYIDINDGGWGMEVTGTFNAIVPSTGNYKVTFYYKNGHTDNPVGSLEFRVIYQGGSQMASVVLGNTVVTTWTKRETGGIPLTSGENLQIQIYGNTGATQTVHCAFDEIMLEAIAAIPIIAVVKPFEGYYVADTQTITVIPSGGSGTFTQVAFDVDNNGSIEYTDNTAGDGFKYDWNTTAHSDGATPVKVTITDSLAATGDVIVNYTVSNSPGRVEFINNGGFETWGGTYPDNWVYFNADPTGAISGSVLGVVSKDTTTPAVGSNALKISYAANPDPYRYTMRSDAFPGDRLDYICWFWGKGGSYCRMYYFQSSDGIAWATTAHGIFSGSTATVWKEVMDTAWEPAAVQTYLSIATHAYSTGDLYWDGVSVTGSERSALASSQTWDLYY